MTPAGTAIPAPSASDDAAGLPVSRRSFLAASVAGGGSLVLGFALPSAEAADAAPELNAWVVVHGDDSVVIRIARSEMGQGSLTGLAQLVAEELDCDWARVSTEFPTPGQSLARSRPWGSFSTGGSRGIRESHDYVRKGGAAARMMLVQAAADEWKVAAAECVAAKGVVTHSASGRSTSYGKVCAAASRLSVPTDIKLRDPKQWHVAGKRVKRLDTAPKLNGSQVYGMDLRLPGMLTAAIRACPVEGGKVAGFDAAAIRSRPGVFKVVQVGDSAVAVVADTWWHANSAVKALKIEWDEGPNAAASSERFAGVLRAGLDDAQAFVGNSAGDARGALAWWG